MNALELDAVTKEHPGSPPVVALEDVTLAVAPGEFVAVTGPSGSGKSTLLALAGTLERPSSGAIRLDGTAVEALSDRELSGVRAYGLGFVFQQYHLQPTRTVLQNVADGLLYRGVPLAERRARAEEAVAAVGLARRAGHRPGELSGGECQRTAIARAMAVRWHSPPESSPRRCRARWASPTAATASSARARRSARETPR